MRKCPTWLLETRAPTYKGDNFLYLGLFNDMELCVEFSLRSCVICQHMYIVSWLNIITKSSCCFWNCDRNSGYNFFYNTLLEIFGRLLYRVLIHMDIWELMMKSMAEVMSTNDCCRVHNEGKILWHYVNDPCKIIITIILVSMFSSCWSWHKKCTFIVLLFLELPFAEWHSYGAWSCSPWCWSWLFSKALY
jgi:hypothetical protein